MKKDSAPEHSKLSPSKASTWTTCTASVPFIKQNEPVLPPDEAGPAAIEGTKAHKVAEAILLGEKIPSYATKDMISHGKAYAEYCREIIGGVGHAIEWGVEKRAKLYYLTEERGTVDFFALTKSGLHLVDYKYGYGEVISRENKQMTIYALSLINEWMGDWDKVNLPDSTVVSLTIFQPRLSEDNATWWTTIEELRKFAAREITPHAVSILSGDKGVFAASVEACKFCRAKGICKAYNDSMLKDFDHQVDSLPDVEVMSEAEILKAYNAAEPLTEWLKAIKTHVNSRVLAGHSIPGLKRVLSNGGHRFWSDEVQAGKILLSLGLPYDEVYPPSDVVSPHQAEKLTKKHKGPKMIELHGLIKKPSGVPIVAPLSDPRPEYVRDYTSDFAEEGFWA